MTTTRDTLQILRDAKSLIERGWTTKNWEYRGRFCAVGAVRKVSGEGYRPSNEAVKVLASVVPDYTAFHTPVDIVTYFNDRQTSKKPVLDAFDRAIARAETSSS